MYINKVIDHRKSDRFGFVTLQPKLRKFHCITIFLDYVLIEEIFMFHSNQSHRDFFEGT